MEVRGRLCVSESSATVLHMIEGDKLTGLATISAVAVLVAMWICKDVILATMKPVAPARQWGRNRWLRLVGREDYVGAHRYRRFA